MADDWTVGDLALCVKVGPWRHSRGGGLSRNDPVKGGGVYTVVRVGDQDGATILWFEGCGDSGDDCYFAYRFRKINPPSADDFDLETIDLMNRKTVGETVA